MLKILEETYGVEDGKGWKPVNTSDKIKLCAYLAMVGRNSEKQPRQPRQSRHIFKITVFKKHPVGIHVSAYS